MRETIETSHTTALDRAIGEYLSHLSVERGLAENTLSSYRRDLRRYSAFLHARDIDDADAIAENDLAEFLMYLREGDPDHKALNAGSAARTLIAARGFHRFALREGIVHADASASVKPPSAPRRLPKALPLSDIEAILDAAASPGTSLALRDRAMLELLYATGARISEAVGLDIDDLDLESGTVLLRGKGSKQRVVPVGSYALDAVHRYLTSARGELTKTGATAGAVFLNARGGRLSRQSAWAVLSKACKRAGITAEVSPHTLRHSFATHLLDGGADVRVVQELLGHASVTTTQIYTLVTVDKLREVYATAHPRARG